MNGDSRSLEEIEAIAAGVSASPPHAEVLVCPPATLIARASGIARGRVGIGGQNCHAEICGAFTGEVSAEMLKDAEASAVIVGHSERRQYFGETDEMVQAKAKAAWRAGLLAIICIGEVEAERLAGGALGVCQKQLSISVPEGALAETTAIAYEPVWAIGTGRTPTLAEIGEMHGYLRRCLADRFHAEGHGMRILYGGSVKPSNAREILAIADVGGALVGGASLKAADFLAIIAAVAR